MTKARIREIRAAIRLVEDEGAAMTLTECIVEIEHIQAFTRQGKIPDAEPEPFPDKAKGKVTDPRVKEFIDGWAKAFQEHHHEKYLVQGAKDGAAVKRLLQIDTVDNLLDLAWEAWKHPDKFNCKQAVTIAGFASRYNDIKIEIKTIASGGRPTSTEPAECRL